MIHILRKALAAGKVTTRYPRKPEEISDHFLGKPVIDFSQATLEKLRLAERVCPTRAISIETRQEKTVVKLSYAKCIFCGLCADVYPEAIRMTKEFELATILKERLETSAEFANGKWVNVSKSDKEESIEVLGKQTQREIARIFKRSLHIRQVDAGSCNGCELEIAALNNPVFDLERFGLHFVASPRHADMLLVTGPVTRNMEIALKKTYEATPEPRLVVAVGACGCSGGIFGESYASMGGVDKIIPVDVYIPGCPPRPQALLHGILLAIGRLKEK